MNFAKYALAAALCAASSTAFMWVIRHRFSWILCELVLVYWVVRFDTVHCIDSVRSELVSWCRSSFISCESFSLTNNFAYSSNSCAYSTPKNALVSRYTAGQQVPSRVMAATLETPAVRETTLPIYWLVLAYVIKSNMCSFSWWTRLKLLNQMLCVPLSTSYGVMLQVR